MYNPQPSHWHLSYTIFRDYHTEWLHFETLTIADWLRNGTHDGHLKPISSLWNYMVAKMSCACAVCLKRCKIDRNQTTTKRKNAWIRNYIHYKVWDEIIYSSPNFNGTAVEVWEGISSFTPYWAWYYLSMTGLRGPWDVVYTIRELGNQRQNLAFDMRLGMALDTKSYAW